MIPINKIKKDMTFDRHYDSLIYLVVDIDKEEKSILLQPFRKTDCELFGNSFWVKNTHRLIEEKYKYDGACV